MKTARLRLSGHGLRGARVSGPLLRDILDVLVDVTRGAVRLRLEGRSSAQGSAPGWVDQAAAFDVLAIEAASTALVLGAPPLAEAVPEQFVQLRIFSGIDAGLSCLDLLGESLEEAVAGKADSDLYDDKLLASFRRFDRVFRHGVEAIELDSGRGVRLDPPAASRLEALQRDIPPDQRVIVAGKLDELRHSDRLFTLILDDGGTVKGVVSSGFDLDPLAQLWGKQARVSGVAKFRPSGAVLRVEAEIIEAATGDVSFWSVMPHPAFPHLDPRKLRVPQGPQSGVNAVFGKWPGEETEDELLAMLDAAR